MIGKFVDYAKGILWGGAGKIHLKSQGHCAVCNGPAHFVAHGIYLRADFKCTKCGTVPRERALVTVLEEHFPNWRELDLHESSPGLPSSAMLARECPGYVATHFFQDVAPGTFKNGIRCENLEAQTFRDRSFDIVVTQDVMEHVLDQPAAFREIARTLKPGGAHIFTTGIHQHLAKSQPRARRRGDGSIEYLADPEYHGNPIDAKGALVTIHYGRDIGELVFRWSGLVTTIYLIRDIELGLAGDFLDVMVSARPELAHADAPAGVISAGSGAAPDIAEHQASERMFSAPALHPQAGFWWTPGEGGSGFTIEHSRATGRILFSAYLYADNGEPIWYVAGPARMTDSTFSARLAAYSGRRSLTGGYRPPTQAASPGNVSISFADTAHGTLTWPGGTVPITRYRFGPEGLASHDDEAKLQTGYWWNPAEGGKGYLIEMQGNVILVVACTYDRKGNPIWHCSGPAELAGGIYRGTLIKYTGGQKLAGPREPPADVVSLGALKIEFASPTTAVLTLPSARPVPIERFGF